MSAVVATAEPSSSVRVNEPPMVSAGKVKHLRGVGRRTAGRVGSQEADHCQHALGVEQQFHDSLPLVPSINKMSLPEPPSTWKSSTSKR